VAVALGFGQDNSLRLNPGNGKKKTKWIRNRILTACQKKVTKNRDGKKQMKKPEEGKNVQKKRRKRTKKADGKNPKKRRRKKSG
jgi:hypothetical protein